MVFFLFLRFKSVDHQFVMLPQKMGMILPPPTTPPTSVIIANEEKEKTV